MGERDWTIECILNFCREPGEEGAISDELVGKLGDATDKLAKLDAFREMALLQVQYTLAHL